MLHQAHSVIVWVYILLPTVMLFRAAYLAMRGKDRSLRKWWLAAFAGLFISVTINSTMAMVQHAKVNYVQILLMAYFATALLLILRGLDALVWGTLAFALRLKPATPQSPGMVFRSMLAMLLRATLLLGIGLPYMIATGVTFRPRLNYPDRNPTTQFKWNYSSFTTVTRDGVELSGWWIPSTRTGAKKTVIICHGLAGSKATQLFVAQRLIAGGYNVAIFDFRGVGESGGHLIGFGALEQQDVLAIVKWVRANHPNESSHVYGAGISTGGAALLAAAVDPSDEGQAIDAVAVLGSFDRTDLMCESLTSTMSRPVQWLTRHLSFPMADFQTGVSLQNFSPADCAKQLWPRPLLVIHAVDDDMVPFERGQAVYDSAMQPKSNYWIENHVGHDGTLTDKDAMRTLKRFFDGAVSIL